MPTDHCLEGLRAARIRTKTDADVLAKIIGVNVRTYYRYELGQRRIHFDKACALADQLGISTDALRRAPDDGTVVDAALGDWAVSE